MPGPVFQVMTMLCGLVTPLPIVTNLGLLHLLWMPVSGRLLGTRGAVIPGLSEAGLTHGQVRRAWAALGQGAWAVDVTACWRPRLHGCPTTHYSAAAGKALPAIPVGIVARVGSAAGQRLGLSLGLVRADPADPSPRAHLRRLLRAAVAWLAPKDALVVDREVGVALLQEVGAGAAVARAGAARRRHRQLRGGHPAGGADRLLGPPAAADAGTPQAGAGALSISA